jgi:hypothetical protein
MLSAIHDLPKNDVIGRVVVAVSRPQLPPRGQRSSWPMPSKEPEVFNAMTNAHRYLFPELATMWTVFALSVFTVVTRVPSR